jgi:hypothetical protein
MGLASTDVQIVMPLAAHLFLCLLPFDWTEKVRGVATRAEAMRREEHHLLGATFSEQLVSALDHGDVLQLSVDNVTYFNSLQTYHAVRFVYAAENRFDLVAEMINKDPAVRSGPRIEFG